MSRFLLVFDRDAGALLEIRKAGSSAREAMNTRLALEDLHATNRAVEVVVLNAESEADLRRTHARYFENVGELVRRTAGTI